MRKPLSLEVDGVKPGVIVIGQDDLEKWGCPFCGYRSGSMPIQCGGAGSWRCGDCGGGCIVVAEELDAVPESWVDIKGTPKGKHPREGTPSHGREDTRPDVPGGEFFRPRGIGMDWTPGCFVCGGANGLHKNIAAFVQCKAAGERVVAMFDQGARLDYRDFEPDRVQVKIGACDGDLAGLEHLAKLKVITRDEVAAALIKARAR